MKFLGPISDTASNLLSSKATVASQTYFAPTVAYSAGSATGLPLVDTWLIGLMEGLVLWVASIGAVFLMLALLTMLFDPMQNTQPHEANAERRDNLK